MQANKSLQRTAAPARVFGRFVVIVDHDFSSASRSAAVAELDR